MFDTIENLQLITKSVNLTTTLKILQQTYMTANVGFVTVKNHFLNHQIDKKVMQALESGLMDYWRHKQDLEPIMEPPAEPQVLTVEHLAIGFKIFAICLAIAVLVFVLEHVLQWIVNR